MDELNFRVNQTAGKIECNFEELKQALAVQMSAYEDAVVTEDTIPAYKGELATLRKIRKAVDDRRKDIKKEFLEPLDKFEENVKLLLEEIDKPIDLINKQLTLFEDDRKLAKKERVSQMYMKQVGEYIKFLPIDTNFNEKWLNKSYTDADITYDISEKLQRVKSDMAVIDGLNSEIKDELIKTYISSNNDLSKAVARNSQYLADKAKVVEQAKAEAIEQAENKVETKVEPKETEVESTENVANPLEGTLLNTFVEQAKTVKLIISANDKDEVISTLDFMGIKYQIAEL